MIKNYHSVQQWNNWFKQYPGSMLLEEEKNFLFQKVIKNHSLHNALLIGAPKQYDLLQNIALRNRFVISPLVNRDKSISYIESDFYELPVRSGSLELVIIPHTLEYIDHPQHLIAEACRTITPGGEMIIIGFNPYGVWGLSKIKKDRKKVPWSGHFIPPETIKKWLKLSDFEFIRKDMIFFRPPLHNEKIFQTLKFMDWIGRKLSFFWGGVYIITARAKLIPLTPIKLHWQQSLPALTISIPGRV